MAVKPIAPSEVRKAKRDALPDEVIQAWNTLIAEHWDGSEAVITQTIARERLVAATGLSKQAVAHYLDIEEVFRAEGWSVEYDRPGYCETYDPTFTFRRKRKRG